MYASCPTTKKRRTTTMEAARKPDFVAITLSWEKAKSEKRNVYFTRVVPE